VLPPAKPPTEFEVADVKLADPAAAYPVRSAWERGRAAASWLSRHRYDF